MKVGGQHYTSIWPDAQKQHVEIIDQTVLPFAFKTQKIHTVLQMERAIRTMQVRGAPLIGASAAYGVALAMLESASDTALAHACAILLASRPTAVNLQWALNRMQTVLSVLPEAERVAAAWQEAEAICHEDIAQNSAIAKHGLTLFKAIFEAKAGNEPLNVLTHCNAGWLATVDIGTALGPIYAAHDAGLPIHVWVDETRPRNQGANLTAWELHQHGVPHTVITDNAGGHLMQQGRVDCCMVGADRIASNGDVCNKIGTYLKALAAQDNQIPFYVAAPSNTFDMTINNGAQIEIENRASEEVHTMLGKLENGNLESVQIIDSVHAIENPAFDVTPARLVTHIITEQGVR